MATKAEMTALDGKLAKAIKAGLLLSEQKEALQQEVRDLKKEVSDLEDERDRAPALTLDLDDGEKELVGSLQDFLSNCYRESEHVGVRRSLKSWKELLSTLAD